MQVHRDTIVIQAPTGSYGYGTEEKNAVLTTADAVATNILTHPLGELEAVGIHGFVIGVQNDGTNGIFRTFTCGFKRAAAGNVTSIGTAAGTDVTDGTTPAVTVAADTTNQLACIRVAGIAAETWKWEIHAWITKIK